MKWTINIEEKAQKQIRKLDKNSQVLVLKYIYTKILKTQDPYILGKALTGKMKGLWRYRVNKYRIVCKIKNEQVNVSVISVAKRDVVYDD